MKIIGMVLLSAKMKIKKLKSFSFLEVILYAAIVGVFVVGVVSFGIAAVYSRAKEFAIEETNSNLIFALKRIEFEISNATSVNSVSASSISLAYATASRNPTVIDLSGGRIRIGYGNSGNCPISSPCFLTSSKINISSLSFTDVSGDGSKKIIRITVAGNFITPQPSKFGHSNQFVSTVKLKSL